jgi:hypothetical protein
MTTKFKNDLNQYISAQQAQWLEEYKKLYFTDDILMKEEDYFEGNLREVRIHNVNTANHETILNEANSNYPNIRIEIVHKSSRNYGHTFYEEFIYSPEGLFKGTGLVLRDAYDNVVSSQFKEINGDLSDFGVEKYYYDLNKNKYSPLFRSEFDLHTAEFQLINYFDESTMHPQAKLYLENTPEDLQKLIDLTGMPLALAQYYFTKETEPNF